jgi:hypothetical protein
VSEANLLSPGRIGIIVTKNRMIMAPMTRSRAGQRGDHLRSRSSTTCSAPRRALSSRKELRRWLWGLAPTPAGSAQSVVAGVLRDSVQCCCDSS